MPHTNMRQPSLTAADRERLLAACDHSTSDGSRDYALLALLIDQALRPGEILALTPSAISGADLLIAGKGRKTRREPLTARAAAAVEAYLQSVGRPGDEPLFVSASGRPLDLAGLATVVRTAAQQAGCGERLRSIHTLRKSVLYDRFQHTRGR
jgi:integrase/recombinase XerD